MVRALNRVIVGATLLIATHEPSSRGHCPPSWVAESAHVAHIEISNL